MTRTAAVEAKLVLLDTIESLFASLPNEAILRSELRRLFRWLKAKGVTAIIPAERRDNRQDEPRRRLCQRRRQTGGASDLFRLRRIRK